MTKNELISDLYLSKDIGIIKGKIKPADIADDVIQHAFLELCLLSEELIQDLHARGKLQHFCVKLIYNTANWSNGTLKKQLGRETPTEDFSDIVDDDEPQEINLPMHKLHWYKSEVLKLYAELGTYQKVADITHIPMCSIYNTVKQAKKEIKQFI